MRKREIINRPDYSNLTKIFAFSWHKCQVCKKEFKHGLAYRRIHYDPCGDDVDYVCTGCAKTKEEAIKYI